VMTTPLDWKNQGMQVQEHNQALAFQWFWFQGALLQSELWDQLSKWMSWRHPMPNAKD
jgi:hypothetical protein